MASQNGMWTDPGIPPVSGNPVLVQSRFGKQGNFELVTPLAVGGMAHFWRTNDDPAHPWSGPTPFGTELEHVDAVTMTQSNFSAGAGTGNLELVAQVGADISLLWRDDLTNGHVWSAPDPVAVRSDNHPRAVNASGPGQMSHLKSGQSPSGRRL